MIWQPIETAPKDGTNILAALVYRVGGNFAGIHVLRWHEPMQDWYLAACLLRFDNTGDPDDDAYPTHWMPLPPAP